MNSKVFYGCRVHIVRLFHSGSIVCNRANPLIDSIIRVDHAGELGADRIYAGQMAVLGNSRMGPVIQHMWDQEKIHKETFEKLIVKYRARPTVMVPVWHVAGFLLGAGTALMGEKAAMACTVAVESVIVEHYNDQLRTLMTEPEKNKELLETIQKFRDDEQEHHDAGLDHGAEQAPFYKGLTEIIKLGCKTAIAVSKEYSNRSRMNYVARSYSTETSSKTSWDLYSAICIERKPVIVKALNSFEQKVMEVFSNMEDEASHKSDHEMRLEADKKRMEALKSNVDLTISDLELLSKETAQDFEDNCVREYNEFCPASRVTKADEENDLKSLDRKLDSHLVLLVKGRVGNENAWVLPQGPLKEGETLRRTAERILSETFEDSMKVLILGNAPWGFYKQKYPKSERKGTEGFKLFFFKAIFLSGDVKLNKNSAQDYQWVTQLEMESLITNKNYLKKVQLFLISDEDYLQSTSRKTSFANK